MIKDHIEEVRNDLKSKRDALLIGHQNLKKDSDDWNKGIIIISLFGGLMESIKMRLELDGAGFASNNIFSNNSGYVCVNKI